MIDERVDGCFSIQTDRQIDCWTLKYQYSFFFLFSLFCNLWLTAKELWNFSLQSLWELLGTITIYIIYFFIITIALCNMILAVLIGSRKYSNLSFLSMFFFWAQFWSICALAGCRSTSLHTADIIQLEWWKKCYETTAYIWSHFAYVQNTKSIEEYVCNAQLSDQRALRFLLWYLQQMSGLYWVTASGQWAAT